MLRGSRLFLIFKKTIKKKMINIFEIIDKTGRKIKLTKERWKHITSPVSPHAYMTNYLE